MENGPGYIELCYVLKLALLPKPVDLRPAIDLGNEGWNDIRDVQHIYTPSSAMVYTSNRLHESKLGHGPSMIVISDNHAPQKFFQFASESFGESSAGIEFHLVLCGTVLAGWRSAIMKIEGQVSSLESNIAQ